MPFHIPAVSQLALSMDWRGGHRADWKGQLCVPGAKPRDGRSRIPQHQANAAPAHPAPSYRHWLCLFRLSRSLLLLLALLGACVQGRFPPLHSPCHVPKSPEAPHVPSPGCQATPNPSRVARGWVPLRLPWPCVAGAPSIGWSHRAQAAFPALPCTIKGPLATPRLWKNAMKTSCSYFCSLNTEPGHSGGLHNTVSCTPLWSQFSQQGDMLFP